MTLHRESDWFSTGLRRLIGGSAVAGILAIPLVLGLVLDTFGWSSSPEMGLTAAGLIILVSTGVLALPWILVAVLPFLTIPSAAPALFIIPLMMAWAFNASITLRGWTLPRLVRIAVVLVAIQCTLVLLFSLQKTPTH